MSLFDIIDLFEMIWISFNFNSYSFIQMSYLFYFNETKNLLDSSNMPKIFTLIF